MLNKIPDSISTYPTYLPSPYHVGRDGSLMDPWCGIHCILPLFGSCADIVLSRNSRASDQLDQYLARQNFISCFRPIESHVVSRRKVFSRKMQLSKPSYRKTRNFSGHRKHGHQADGTTGHVYHGIYQLQYLFFQDSAWLRVKQNHKKAEHIIHNPQYIHLLTVDGVVVHGKLPHSCDSP